LRDLYFASHELTFATQFQKIFVISLPTRPDHRDALTLASTKLGINFEFVDAVTGDAYPDKGFPSGAEDFHGGARGEWRSQMNIMQRIVKENIASALILEDDNDFDVRIMQQLSDFALASRALTQPLAAESNATTTSGHDHDDDTYHDEEDDDMNMRFDALPNTLPPLSSPYGDNWDVLWLGHCGIKRPFPSPSPAVVRYNDLTTVSKENQHTIADSWYNDDLRPFPQHTRLYSFTADGSCTQAYAISNRGAQHYLYEYGVQEPVAPVDMQLRGFCSSEHTEDQHVCVTVQPALFSQYRGKGSSAKDSNINDHGGEVREKAFSLNLRLSARLNLLKLVEEKPVEEMEDQFPDEYLVEEEEAEEIDNGLQEGAELEEEEEEESDTQAEEEEMTGSWEDEDTTGDSEEEQTTEEWEDMNP
jgi:GR25 family glycosyltransferase involved in LPS biosynthesis